MMLSTGMDIGQMQLMANGSLMMMENVGPNNGYYHSDDNGEKKKDEKNDVFIFSCEEKKENKY